MTPLGVPWGNPRAAWQLQPSSIPATPSMNQTHTWPRLLTRVPLGHPARVAVITHYQLGSGEADDTHPCE